MKPLKKCCGKSLELLATNKIGNIQLETFVFTFFILLVLMLIMSLGVILMGKNIKGSCGGLNAISGSDKCSICNKDIDPNNPLVNQLKCKNLSKTI